MKTLKKLTIIVCILFFNSLIAQNDYDKIQTLLSKAEKAKDSAQYDEALKWTKQAQSIHSNGFRDTLYLNINNKFIEIYNEKGRYDSSMRHCKKLLQISNEKLELTKAYAHTLELTAQTYSLLSSVQKAIKYHKQCLELKKQLYPKTHISIAYQLIQYGGELNLLKNFKLAKQQFQLAESIINNIQGHVTLKLDLYRNAAHNNVELYDSKSALKYAHLYLDLVKTEYDEKSSQMGVAYKILGNIYKFKEDYEQAIENLKISEQIFISNNVKNDTNLASIYYSLARIYDIFSEYYRAIKYYEKAILIYQTTPTKNNYDLGLSYFYMGNSYRMLRKREEAIKYMEKGKQLVIKSLGKKHPDIASMDTSIASCLDVNKNSDKAVQVYKKALEIYEQADAPYLQDKRFCHFSISRVYRNTKKYKQALVHSHKIQKLFAFDKYEDSYIHSLYITANDHFLLKQFDSTGYYLNQMPKYLKYDEKEKPYQFDSVRYIEELFNYLFGKSQYFKAKFTETKDESYLDSIHHQNQKFLAAQEYWDDQSTSTADKLQRLNDYIIGYEDCIESYVRYKKSLNPFAFEVTEKTKTRLLKIHLSAAKATNFSNIPESLLLQDIQLKKSIAKFEKLRFESESDSIKKECTNRLFKLKRQKDELYNLILNEYPHYHNLKYNNQVINVREIQQKLGSNETLVEYFVGQDYVYLFTITNDKYNVVSIKTPNNLEQWVTQLRNSIYNFDNEEQTKQYLSSAHHLYNTLIAPIKKELKHKLTIIPDGVLNYIPFETLLEERAEQISSYKDLPYLIKNHQISYNYSATLYHQLLTQKGEAAKENLVAFAPSFKDNKEKFNSITERRNGFENLLYNIPEAEMAHEYISGSLFKGNEATENNFLKNAEDYKIIHLSTHAKSNDKLGDYSFIAMSNVNDSIDDANRIYTSELYNLNLKADMVVLSACETGLGELQKGEGIISLARAFTYAGAKSTINSLWSVNDASTKTLMEEFYKNIKAGKTKDQALHEAKLSYLENEDMDAPYFWASFIAMGNMEPIALSSGFNYWWLLLLPVIFGLIYFVKRRK